MTTVAACQLAVDDLDVGTNLDRIERRIAGLPEEVELAVFPEMALTGFVADDRIREAAVALDGPEIERLRERAAEVDCHLLVGTVADDRDLVNAAVYVRPDGTTTTYRKRHLWGGEREYLTAGEERVVVDTPLGRAALVTCYDLNFVAESAAFTDDRVDALLVIGAWPAAHSENWRLLVRARALDGARWAVAAGRTGRREVAGARTAEYAGRSLIARPDGGVRASLATDERDLVATLDDEVLAEQRDLVGIFDG